MRRCGLVTALIYSLVAACPSSLFAQAGQRSLYVSVLDKSGTPVSGVLPADLIVREDDAVREVLRVAPADEPLHVALLVDDSEEAEPYVRDYREAFPAFITAVLQNRPTGGPHQVALIALASRPTVLTDYTSDSKRLLQGTQRIFSQSGTGTYLLDGIVEVSAGIRKRGSTQPVIIAVTAEGPELSHNQFDLALDSLRQSGATFHVVVLGRPVNESIDRMMALTRGPRDSGGSYDMLLAGTALTAKMKALAAELTGQYRVTYARPDRLIPPERVTVASANPRLTVRGAPSTAPAAEGRR